MKTAERAQHLAAAAAGFPFLGETTAEVLLELVRVELGDAGALDGFQRQGAHWAQAIPPVTICHIISGNTPAAGLQSLIRGLLLGSHNLGKLPAAGCSELLDFRAKLPAELAARVEFSTTLPADWLGRAEAVIVFGSDETVAHFRGLVRPDQVFAAHGHGLSFGVIFDDTRGESAAAAAADVAAFDQQGCLSPQVFYVASDARGYAAKLAVEMDRGQQRDPRGAVSLAVSSAIRALREDVEFRAANGESMALHASAGSTAWTVIYDETPGFPRTPMHRTIFVKPLRAFFAEELAEVRGHLSCAGIWPATLENARALAGTGVSRICPIGKMQKPPWTWLQDGRGTLRELVTWIGAELRS